MKKIIAVLILFIISVFLPEKSVCNNSDDWHFDDNYKKKRIFIHAFANYDLDSSWQMDWEQNLFKKNALKTAFGSVTVKDLNSEINLKLNMKISNSWWFRSSFLRRRIQYKNSVEDHNFMGFEKFFSDVFSIFILCNAFYDKEDIDILLGLSVMNKNLENYCRIALTYDNFLYDEKNPFKGKVSSVPLGIDWAIRFSWKDLILFTEGKYVNSLDIDFTDQELSPQLYFSKNQINHLTWKLYYFFGIENFFEVRFNHYHFLEQKLYYHSPSDYSYLHEIYEFAGKYQQPFSKQLILSSSLHYIVQNSAAEGLRDYNFTRREIIPTIILKYSRVSNTWELGIIRSSYRYELEDVNDPLSYNNSNSTLKIMLRWAHLFNQNTKLQFSLSHVPYLEGYGGGNLDFMIFF